ncbi:MAG: phosphopentomutase, partial [Enterobacterales bacterium]|nr:phosphopentomutase [Enterobacterales bacterium]
MKRTFIMVLDSFGIGASEDAERFGDVGSDTLGHIADACARGEADIGRKGPLTLPNLSRLGLGKAAEESTGRFPQGLDKNADIIGAYGYASELSSGKDTPSGHWEIAGVPVLFDWGYFSEHENSFPQELLDILVKRG